MTNEKIVDHFALRANKFNNNGWASNDIILDTIKNALEKYSKNPHIRLLDYGAGTGIVSKYLLDEISDTFDVTALDISPEMLSCVGDDRIKCVISSVEKTPFKDSEFDVIISRQCLHYVKELDKTLFEAKRILKEKGLFILTQFVPLDSITKKYWEELTEIRQPLRVNYFSEIDWINCFQKNGFIKLYSERFSVESSVAKWSDQYQMIEDVQKQKYIKKLQDAPSDYIRDYGIIYNEKDIIGKTYGVTIVFEAL